MSDHKIIIGKIVGAHALRGEVRVQTYTENPLDLRDMNTQGAGKILSVRLSAPNSTVVIARIEDVDDRNAAEALRDTEIFITRGSLPPTKADEYYIADLIGMDVFLASGQKLGKVADVQNFGAGDILELDTGEMLSFHGAKVDIDKRVIKI
jgi:16S rRNA processing protein RimM